MKSYEKFISKEDIKKIHQNTLRILENVGVAFENERAHEVFKKHGAKLDGNVVYIPEKMVEKALAGLPDSFTLHANSTMNATLGGCDKIITAVGGNIYIEDNGKIRKANNFDNINQFMLTVMSKITTSATINQFPDRSKFTQDQKIWANMAMALRYSPKYHFNLSVNTREVPKDEVLDLSKKGIQFIRNFEGIDDNEKYIAITGVNTLSPLTFDFEPIEKIFASCQENQPIWIAPCAMPLLTAPASVAGLMSTANAEVLAGLVLSQLIKPGLPVLYGNVSGSTDMRTIQLCIGSPEAALISYATAGLADLYHLPFRAGGSLCDAKNMDAQAGTESMMMIYATIDSGADYIMHLAGTMGAYNIVSFEKYILDEEIINMVNRQLRGIDVSEEKLCFDEIKKVGPRGTFLHGRTPKMYREEFYMAKLFNKDDPNNWQNAGSKSIKEIAAKEVKKRIDNYVAPERTKEQLKLLKPYLPDAYKDSLYI